MNLNRQPTLRKLILDLTPLIDMITILMFGVMIHAVELSRQEGSKASEAVQHSTADREALLEVRDRAKYLAEREAQLAEQVKELRERLSKTEEELKALQARREQEQREVAEALAKLLGGLDAEKLKKALADQDLSESGSRRILNALKESENDVNAAVKAVRRIAEMEKVFTFIDFHLDANDMLTIAVNGQRVDRLPMRDKSPTEMENLLKGKFQAPDFNQIVLFMYSYEGDARYRTVQRLEQAIKALRDFYEARYVATGKQFRFASVGSVAHAPPTIEPSR